MGGPPRTSRTSPVMTQTGTLRKWACCSSAYSTSNPDMSPNRMSSRTPAILCGVSSKRPRRTGRHRAPADALWAQPDFQKVDGLCPAVRFNRHDLRVAVFIVGGHEAHHTPDQRGRVCVIFHDEDTRQAFIARDGGRTIDGDRTRRHVEKITDGLVELLVRERLYQVALGRGGLACGGSPARAAAQGAAM